VDISITADARGLWVNTFMDGKLRYFDLSDPESPRQVYEKVVGSQNNMVSQSWDGKRVYVTSSLLANWDKKGADDQQYLALYHWDGKELAEQWRIDFYQQKLGRAHHMKFGAKAVKQADTGVPRIADR
jgi:selenium-binding protein 1